ncbi:morn repeat-containing protein [Cystoisospora suis]|uniref:Morn repeat-containing protein n=1 Tax=Cystoisospora suis TaxID=483139 RepID=A0A2C6LHU9_9APIC|nr:morn repeat-containing protein [Cystoisospora suis]
MKARRKDLVKMTVQEPAQGASNLSAMRGLTRILLLRWFLLIIVLSNSTPFVHYDTYTSKGIVTPVSGLDLFSSLPSAPSSSFFRGMDTKGKESHQQSSIFPSSWWPRNEASKKLSEPESSGPAVSFPWSFSLPSSEKKGSSKADASSSTTTPPPAVKYLAKPAQVTEAPTHLPRTVKDIPKTPADFFFVVEETSGTAGVNAGSQCIVEPSTFPVNAKNFVVQCPSGVSKAALLLLTRNPRRKFRRTGSSSTVSRISVEFPEPHEEANELSLDVCDEPEEASTALSSSSQTTPLSLSSSVLPFVSSSSPENSSDTAALFPSSLEPISSSAVCRPVFILPVAVPAQPSLMPRLAHLALSKGVGSTTLQPAFDPEVSEYRAVLPESQSATIVAQAAPGFFVKLEQGESSLFSGSSTPSAGKHHPLADSVNENKTTGFYMLTCGEAGSVHHVNAVVYSATTASLDICSSPGKCEDLFVGDRLPAIVKPVTYTVHLHCVAPQKGRAALASIDAQVGTLQPSVFSPQNHLYYLRLPEGTDKDIVTFKAGDSHTDILVGEEGRRNTGQAKSVRVRLEPNEASKVIPIKTVAKAQGGEQTEEGELYFLVLIRGYPTVSPPDGGRQQDVELEPEPLLKKLTVVGSTLKPPFDPAIFHFTADVPHDRKFVGLQLEEAIPSSQMTIDGKVAVGHLSTLTVPVTQSVFKSILDASGTSIRPKYQAAFFRLKPGETKVVTITVRRPISRGTRTTPEENERRATTTYTVELRRSTPWLSGASLVPFLADVTCWGSALVNSFVGAGWLAVSKTLNLVAVTGAIPGTPEMWRSFSGRFSDFGLQFKLPASMVEIIDESPQTLGAPQLLPSSADLLWGRLFSWSLFGSQLVGSAPVLVPVHTFLTSDKASSQASEGLTLSLSGHLTQLEANIFSSHSPASTARDFGDVSPAVLAYLEAASDRFEVLSRFTSCILIHVLLLAVFGVLYGLVLLRRFLERRHQQNRRTGEGGEETKEGLWRYLPQNIALPASVWIFVLDYGLISFVQASAGLAFAEKTISVSVGGVVFSPWSLFAIGSALLVIYPVSYLAWVSFTLAFLRKKVVYCPALDRFTDRRIYEVKARVRSSCPYLPPALADLLSWDIRSVAPVKGPSVSLDDTPGVVYSSDVGDNSTTSGGSADEDDADEEAAAVYHSSFNCGGGMALCRTTSLRSREPKSHPVSQQLTEAPEQAKNKLNSFCATPTWAPYAALPQECAFAVKECAYEDSKELALLAEEERESATDSVSSDKRKSESHDEWELGNPASVGGDIHTKQGADSERFGGEPVDGPKIVVRLRKEATQKGSKRDVLLQLDADAYEAHGYEVANAVTGAKYPGATVGLVSLELSGTPSETSSGPALCTEAEVQLDQLTSLAWLCGGALQPFHLWVPFENLQFGYADKFALLLPSSESGCARSLLHFLTVRMTLACAVLAVSVWQATTALPDGDPGLPRLSSDRNRVFPFLMLILAGLMNLALHFPAAARQAVARWDEAKSQEGRENRRGHAGSLTEDEHREDGGGGLVKIRNHDTQAHQSKELRREWMAWKDWKGKEAARAAPGPWTRNVQFFLRKALQKRIWRSRTFFVARDLCCGLLGSELAKGALLLLLLSCNDHIGHAHLHVAAAFMGGALVLLAVTLPSAEALQRAASVWGAWLRELQLRALVASHWLFECVSNWRFYVKFLAFYARLCMRQMHSLVTANRRKNKPTSWRYPGYLVFINKKWECSVNKLHVVVPEAGLVFNAPAPKVEPMPGTKNHREAVQQEGFIAACTEKLLNMKAVSGPPRPSSVALNKRLICVGPVPRGHVECQMPVQIEAQRVLEGLRCQRSATKHSNGHLVATIQVVNQPNYRYPLYDRAYSMLPSFLVAAKRQPSLAWFRNVFGDRSYRNLATSRSLADSYLSLYTDESLIPPRGENIRLSESVMPSIVRFDARMKVIKILCDEIQLGAVYGMRPRLKQQDCVSEDPRSKAGEGRVTAKTSTCLVSGRLHVDLRAGAQVDIRGEIEVTECSAQSHGERTFIIDPSEVAVNYDETLNRLLLRHREFKRGCLYTTSYHLKSAALPPPWVEGLRAKERGQLHVPWNFDRLPNLHDYFLVFKAEEEEHSEFTVDPALTDAHVCTVPPVVPAEFLQSEASCAEVLRKSKLVSSSIPSQLSQTVSAVFNIASQMVSRDRATFAPPVPCTLLKRLPGQTDELDSAGGAIYRVEPNYQRQRLELAAEIDEKAAQLQDLLRNSAAALPSVAEAVFSKSELMQFFVDRGVHTNSEPCWLNPLNYEAHPLLRSHATRLRSLKAELIDILAVRLEKSIRQLDRIVQELKVLESMQGDTVLRSTIHDQDIAIQDGKGMEELCFLQLRIDNIKKMHYQTNVVRPLPFPLEIEVSCIARKPRLAEQFRQWEEQLGLWLTGEVGATPHTGAHGGPGRLESAVDDILQQVYECLFSRLLSEEASNLLVLHFVTSSFALCGGPSTWRPDPLPAHSAFVQLWEVNGGDEHPRPVWVPCFIKLTASALQFVFPHFFSENLSAHGESASPTAKPETRVVPLQFLQSCEVLAASAASLSGDHYGDDIDELLLPEDDESFPQLRAQHLKLQFAAMGKDKVASDSEAGWVLPVDQLALHNGSSPGERLFCFFPSKNGAAGPSTKSPTITVRTSSRYLGMWQTMLLAAEMHRPKQVIEGYEGKVRYLLPSSASRPEGEIPKASSPPSFHLLFADSVGEQHARRGGAADHPRTFSSFPSNIHAFSKCLPSSRVLPRGGRLSDGLAVGTFLDSNRTYTPLPTSPDGEIKKHVQLAELTREQRQKRVASVQAKRRAAATRAEQGPLLDLLSSEEDEGEETATTEVWLDVDSRYDARNLHVDSLIDADLQGQEHPEGSRNGDDTNKELSEPHVNADSVSTAQQESGASQEVHHGDRQCKEIGEGGQWVREGPGEQVFTDASQSPPVFLGRYVGDWSSSRYHGKGDLFDGQNRLVYTGEWANGRRWGPGVACSIDANGSWWRQEGVFVNDELEGEFKLTRINGNTLAHYVGTGESSSDLAEVRIQSIRGEVPPANPGAVKPLNATCPFASVVWGAGPQPCITQACKNEYLPFLTKWKQLLGPSSKLSNITLFDRINKTFSHILFEEGSEFFRAPRAAPGAIEGRLETKRFTYEGAFLDGRAHGQGKMTSRATGSEYDGEWSHGQRNGRGILKLSVGDINITVTSSFKDNVACCQSGRIEVVRAVTSATESALPFTSYAGSLEDGLPHGVGVMAFGGFLYEGEFTKGCREGKGVIVDLKKKGFIRVDGQWKDDVPHGRMSRVVYPDGSIYAGDFLHGNREGHGTLVLDSVVVYDGLWMNDVPHGRGTFVTGEGTYEGEIRNGQRHGKGRFTFSGETTDKGKLCVYEGDWEDDLPHGVGKYCGPSGQENAFLFVRGEIDPALKSKRADKGGNAIQLPPVGAAPFITKNSAWWQAGSCRLDRAALARALDDPDTQWGDYSNRRFELEVQVRECVLEAKTDQLRQTPENRTPIGGRGAL